MKDLKSILGAFSFELEQVYIYCLLYCGEYDRFFIKKITFGERADHISGFFII